MSFGSPPSTRTKSPATSVSRHTANLFAGPSFSVVNGILVARPFDQRGESSAALPFPSRRHWRIGPILDSYTPIFGQRPRHAGYPPQSNSLTELRWRDRTGKQLGTLGAPGKYYTPRISPTASEWRFARDGDNSDIWVATSLKTPFTRLTFIRPLMKIRYGRRMARQ